MPRREQATIGAVERALAGGTRSALVRPVVLHLLWTGRLRADLRRPLGADTPVQLAAGGGVMSGQVLSLAPGSRLVFDGEVVEVVAIDGVRVDAPQRPHPPVHRRADFPAGGIGPSGGRTAGRLMPACHLGWCSAA